MTSIVSRNISRDPTSTDYNQLRADVVDNHSHDGAGGQKIAHDNLLFGSGYTLVNKHKDLDEHVAASSGEHGKLDGVYLVGSLGSNATIVTGNWSNNEANTCGAGMSGINGHSGFDRTFYVNLSGPNNFTCADPPTSLGHIKFADTNYVVIVQMKNRLHNNVTFVIGTKHQTYFEMAIYNDAYNEIPAGDLVIDWMAIGQLEAT